MSVVLDASALIAMLKGERGAGKVAAGIAGARVSSVNYAEVVSTRAVRSCRLGHEPVLLILAHRLEADSAGFC